MPTSRFSPGVQAVPLEAASTKRAEQKTPLPMSPSKRALLAGGAAVGLGAAQPSAWSFDDPSLAICRRWLALDRARERLLTEWSQLEARLMRDPEWRGLPDKAQTAHSGSRRLAEIDRQLERLFDEGEAVFARLPSTPATKIETVIAHLSVAERLLPPDENDQVHGLIARAVRDLSALTTRP